MAHTDRNEGTRSVYPSDIVCIVADFPRNAPIEVLSDDTQLFSVELDVFEVPDVLYGRLELRRSL